MPPDTDGDPDPDAFGERLKAAQQRATPKPPRDPVAAGAGLGFGLRVVVELVSAVAVGIAIGWGLDAWLGTRPWLLLLFLCLGFAAGVMNVQRAAKDYEARRQRAADGTETR